MAAKFKSQLQKSMTKDMSCHQYNLPIKYNQQIMQHRQQTVIVMKNNICFSNQNTIPKVLLWQ